MSEEKEQEQMDALEVESGSKEKITTGDPFTRLMFGSHQPRSMKDRDSQNSKTESITESNDNQDNDYLKLMQQIDEIMGSVTRIKPMVKELSPIINLFQKK